MATPLLPTHARGHKQKRKGSGAKELLYVVVALIVGYLVFANWHGSAPADQIGKETEGRILKGDEEVSAATPGPHGGRHLERQDAMKNMEELQRVSTIRRDRRHSQRQGGQEQEEAASSPVDMEQQEQQHTQEKHVQEAQPQSFFDLSAIDIDGNNVHFSKYAGKVVIVVNVASACGYTDQNYKGLQSMYQTYKEHGLEILGFPCNQFGNQESKSESEIKAFCSGTYHVTFPMFSKIEVNGPNTHPVYQFLKHQLPVSEGGGGGAAAGTDLPWNFIKFVVDKKGQPAKMFPQTFEKAPLEQAIYTLLGLKAAVRPATETGTVEQQQQQQAASVTTEQKEHEVKAADAHVHFHPVPIVDGKGVEVHDNDKVPDQTRSFFDLSAIDIDGNNVHFSKYAGKVLVVVNVASACGFTDQNYKGLERTYLKYKEHGVEILGFPCNQFGGQEPKNESEIKAFCSDTYHVTFPLFSKIDVNGPNTHPVYQFLKRQLPVSEGGGGGTEAGKDLSWNFFKFLVNKQGQPVKLLPRELDVPALQEQLYQLLHE